MKWMGRKLFCDVFEISREGWEVVNNEHGVLLVKT